MLSLSEQQAATFVLLLTRHLLLFNTFFFQFEVTLLNVAVGVVQVVVIYLPCGDIVGILLQNLVIDLVRQGLHNQIRLHFSIVRVASVVRNPPIVVDGGLRVNSSPFKNNRNSIILYVGIFKHSRHFEV